MKALLKFRNTLQVLVIVLLFISACTGDPSTWVRNTNAGPALGTSYSIIYLTKDFTDLQTGIDSVFNAVNASMSTYIPDSDISRINKGDTSVQVDHMFMEVLAISKEVYQNTDGYFDPTVGILVNAWGFGPEAGIQMDSAYVNSLLHYVGLNKVSLTQDNRILKEQPEIQLDFNAIAKGYTIDRLAAYLDAQGIKNYLVEVGGEIITKGENRVKQKRWVVGVDDPQVELGRQLKITLNLKDKALASSGNYRKFRIDSLTGVKYVHTIDPKTGFTKNSNILAATVVAETCAMADAYATAFMAMDLPNSIALLEQQKDLEGYIIYLDAGGQATEFMTAGFKKMVNK
jgi:thiamine biosynthesis lipoprotein